MRVIQKSGYTIVETMIALAVTTAMLGITIALTSSQLARQQFRTAAQNAQQQVQDVLNDVQSGYFSGALSSLPGCGIGGTGTSTECYYVGKKVTIDTASRELVVTPLYIRTSGTLTSPINSPGGAASLREATSQTIALPGSLDYTEPVSSEVYILFANYPDTSSPNPFVGGAQSVGAYIKNGSQINQQTTSSPRYVCIANGNRKAKISIGVAGSPKVAIDYAPIASECP